MDEVTTGEWEAAVNEMEATEHEVAMNESKSAEWEGVTWRRQLGHRQPGLHMHHGRMHIAMEAGAIVLTRSGKYRSLFDPIVQDCISYCLAFTAPLRSHIIGDRSADEFVVLGEGIRFSPRHVEGRATHALS